MLLLVGACGDTQPLPDIDATVEARVEPLPHYSLRSLTNILDIYLLAP